MAAKKDTRWKQLDAILNEVRSYYNAIGKMEFDTQCCAPPEGMERAGQDMAVLGTHVHKLTHSKKYVNLLTSLHEDPAGLDEVQKRAIDVMWFHYQRSKNQTPKFAFEMSKAFNTAYGKWLEAKQTSDFSIFRDSLEDVVKWTRKSIELMDEQPSTLYNGCLDGFERGGSEKQLDAFFAALKKRIVPLIKKIQKEGSPVREDFLNRPCPVAEQEQCSRWVLEKECLRQSALVLMTTEHPFTTSFGPHDVRVTTHYYEDAFLSSIFSTLHEGGHALFMQNEPEEFVRNHNDGNMSNAMHECISRFYENIIGRSRAFIHFIYPELCRISPSVMDGVSEEELYRGINIARPSLIRTEADELTYSLHILIRYEIEKELINGRMKVDEVPAAWNAKYKEYLGVDVPDDAHGCLQDVHWTMSFGYFPSYALGNAYGAQILNTMQKEFDVFGDVEKGDLSKVLAWLKENVFACAGMLDPDAWIKKITGESLNVKYYLDYLEKKYSEIYKLK